MADLGMPDTLTPAQMVKLGGAAHPDDLPDTLTPDQMERGTEQPKSYPPTEDERAGIDSPLASPRGLAWDSRTKEFRKASGLGMEKSLPPGFVPERGLVREDPAMDVATTMAGGGAGKLIGRGVAKLSPIAAKLVEPAVAGGVTSALQGGDAKQNLASAAIGGALGIPGAALTAVRGAPAAVAERLPTAVTGGLKSKAAKQVVAGNALNDVLDAHPQLKSTLATSGSVADKFNATGATLGKLTAANDAVYDAIQAQHQGIPLDAIAKKIKAVADTAHADGNEVLEKAAESAIDNLQRYGDVADKRGAVATATQVRGVRNNLARRVQAINPTLPPTEAQAAADEIKRAINEGIEDVASKTKGVDVDELRARNRQIAALMPVQRTLREQALAAKLLEGGDPLAEFIKDPKKKIAGLVSSLPAHLDAQAAKRPGLQSFAEGAAGVPTEIGQRLGFGSNRFAMGRNTVDLPVRSLMAGTASHPPFAARRPRPDDLEYAARVSQGMKNGMSLQEAIDAAEAR